MPIRHDFNMWECKYCHKIYKLEMYALGCEHSHNIIYVPLRKEDLKALMNFMLTKDERFLTETLVETLRKYTHNMSGSEA